MDTPEVILSLQRMVQRWNPSSTRRWTYIATVVAPLCAGTTAFSKMSLQMYWRNQRLLAIAVCFFGGESHDYEEKIEHFE